MLLIKLNMTTVEVKLCNYSNRTKGAVIKLIYIFVETIKFNSKVIKHVSGTKINCNIKVKII